MDGIISEYNVEKLQLISFNASTKELLSQILRFERLLLENSTNRKTFNSYDVSHLFESRHCHLTYILAAIEQFSFCL